MSGRHSAVMFVCVVAIAMATQRAENAKDSLARGPASIAKEPLRLHDHGASLRHTQKLRGPIEATIEVIGAKPEKAGDVFVLRGLIASTEDVANVGFKWSLPEGIELVSGEVKDVVSSLSSDQPYVTELTLRQVTSENAQVHFLVRAASHGIRFADSVQYNTLVQDLLDASRKETLRANSKESESKSRFKIFH